MRYFLIAGEASGDLHAAGLMHELKKQDPHAEFCFLGGDLMQREGGTLVRHYRNMAFMGIINVVLNIGKVLENLKICKENILKFQPDALILVDYPSFNLRIAKYVKKHCPCPVYYYIPPKIWAWKEYRIKDIKKYVDKIFCILPFEPDFYATHGYEVAYVGNPCVDAVAGRNEKEQSFDEFTAENRLDRRPIVSLLAGSRKQEIRNCLPVMLQVAANFPDFQFVVAAAPGIEPAFYTGLLPHWNFALVFDKTYQLLQQSFAAVVNSGTATLETALLNIPQVVVYHVPFGRLATIAKEIILKIKYVSLVNLIAGKEVVKELTAHLFTPKNLQNELSRLLFDELARKNMLAGYKLIQQKCGSSGVAESAAKGIVKELMGV